jgi:hypothetical protein
VTYSDNGNSLDPVGEARRLVLGVLLGHVFLEEQV